MARRSVSGLRFRVAFGGELEDLRRWNDLRLGRLKDRIAFGCIPGGESLAQVVPVGIFAGNLESLEFFELLAERLALGVKLADPGCCLGDLLVRGQRQLAAVGVADGGRFGGA
jgi:hypothetical protein